MCFCNPTVKNMQMKYIRKHTSEFFLRQFKSDQKSLQKPGESFNMSSKGKQSFATQIDLFKLVIFRKTEDLRRPFTYPLFA